MTVSRSIASASASRPSRTSKSTPSPQGAGVLSAGRELPGTYREKSNNAEELADPTMIEADKWDRPEELNLPDGPCRPLPVPLVANRRNPNEGLPARPEKKTAPARPTSWESRWLVATQIRHCK